VKIIVIIKANIMKMAKNIGNFASTELTMLESSGINITAPDNAKLMPKATRVIDEGLSNHIDPAPIAMPKTVMNTIIPAKMFMFS
jgi:hypothetical protein